MPENVFGKQRWQRFFLFCHIKMSAKNALGFFGFIMICSVCVWLSSVFLMTILIGRAVYTSTYVSVNIFMNEEAGHLLPTCHIKWLTLTL